MRIVIVRCVRGTPDQPCSMLSAPHCQGLASLRMGRWLAWLILCVQPLG